MVLRIPQGGVLGSLSESQEFIEEAARAQRSDALWPIDEEETAREDDQGAGRQLQRRAQTVGRSK